MNIKKLDKFMRPREKAEKLGISKLSDIELLSIIIRTGMQENSVKSISSNILDTFGGFKGLTKCSIFDLIKIKGIGQVKAQEILAIFEISKRINSQRTFSYYRHDNEIYEYAINKIGSSNIEKFLLITTKLNKIIIDRILFKGSSSVLSIEINKILAIAIENNSDTIFCIHNHPSGSLLPSQIDIKFSKKLTNFSKILGIKIIKNIIVNDIDYYEIK